MTERTMLLHYRQWLEATVIPGFVTSSLPPSWKDDSIRRTYQQIADIDWRLETEPPRDVPNVAHDVAYQDRLVVARQRADKGREKRNRQDVS